MYLYSGRHLKFPGSLLPDTLCLFVIRYACSRFSMSGRDTPCLGQNTLYLFEECGACSHYGDWVFVVPVATTNWILTLIPPYNNTSFGWFLLRKIVECCCYTLSISLSSPTRDLNPWPRRPRGGHGFECHWSHDIFQASSFHLLK